MNPLSSSLLTLQMQVISIIEKRRKGKRLLLEESSTPRSNLSKLDLGEGAMTNPLHNVASQK
jgi:hypothetical protein